jgi:hypothetical protein
MQKYSIIFNFIHNNFILIIYVNNSKKYILSYNLKAKTLKSNFMEKQSAYGFVQEEMELMEFQNLRNEKLFTSLYSKLPNIQFLKGTYLGIVQKIRNTKTSRKFRALKNQYLK